MSPFSRQTFPSSRIFCVVMLMTMGTAAADGSHPLVGSDRASVNDPYTCAHLWQEIGLPQTHKPENQELGTAERDRLNAQIADLTKRLETVDDTEAKKLKRERNQLVRKAEIMQKARERFEEMPRTNIICRDHFITQYNSYTKNPDWVIERLDRKTVTGPHTRPNTKFTRDPNLPIGAASAVDRDYGASNLSRGHQAASADFTSNEEWMKATFVFSNAVPQTQDGFNGGIWKDLEEHVQDLAKSLKDDEAIYVITGPVDMNVDGSEIIVDPDKNACGKPIRLAGFSKLKKRSICDANDRNPDKICDHGVAVPSGLFKIIYSPHRDRAVGYLMSNEDHRNLRMRGTSVSEYLEQQRASIDLIEDLSDLNFFTGKSQRWRRVHEESCPVQQWRQ